MSPNVPDTLEVARMIEARSKKELTGLLPQAMRGDVDRVIMRAALFYTRHPELHKCTRGSVMDCVLQAGELGLTLDGRLCYAIPYGAQCQLQISYKGYVHIARKAGLIKDAYARLVYRGEAWKLRHSNGRDVIEHDVDLTIEQKDENVIGAYVILDMPDGRTRYEFMRRAELDACRRVAKGSRAWSEWFGEMAKKSVIKRALKGYQDEPEMGKAFENDQEADFDGNREISLGTIGQPATVEEEQKAPPKDIGFSESVEAKDFFRETSGEAAADPRSVGSTLPEAEAHKETIRQARDLHVSLLQKLDEAGKFEPKFELGPDASFADLLLRNQQLSAMLPPAARS
jgi:recombination protein RecT